MAGPCTIPFDVNVGPNSEPPEEVLPLTGTSLLALSKRSVPTDQTLLGERWLCVGGGAMIVGPSGIGKSTLAVQAAALWSCGCSAFGIRAARPLRVLVTQAEDDEGDSVEMAKMVNHLDLDDRQRELIGQNTHLEFLNDKTGHAFILRLGQMMTLFKPDIVIINPLSAYLGDDTKDEKSVNQFLRTWLNPILTTHRAAAIFMHHTPKTTNRDTSSWKATDWMYSGSGVAGITNWARAYLVIEPTGTHGVFRLIAAKRGQRIGWDGFEQYWAHTRDEGKLLWVPADREQISMAKKAAKKTPDDLLAIIPKLDPISREQLILTASGHGIGRDKTRDFVEILIDQKKAFAWKLPRPGKKSAIGYAQRAQPEEE